MYMIYIVVCIQLLSLFIHSYCRCRGRQRYQYFARLSFVTAHPVLYQNNTNIGDFRNYCPGLFNVVF